MKTPLYHPQANQVEATNKSIKLGLRAHMADLLEHCSWENHLSRVIHDINTSVHSATGYTPYFLHTGREYVKDGNEYKLLLDVNPYHTQDVEQRKVLADEIRDKQFELYQQTAQRALTRKRERHFEIGSEVYIPNPKQSVAGEGYAQKLAPPKIRAYVSRKLGSNSYELIDAKHRVLGNYSADLITTR
ncbi:uncharacterized protein LOC118755915 [Rhagoletis pomonella]|uniref:uncharacterized protein LOC118755612 n=1 Tax=Rhagoletis pomonella TaxID=28610 RepID=UPI001784AAF2|nr:uncharacterized protein LOC118755612 [Rhagoletis pomonella]XP_036346607.1 uncharacterized protein LOC118755915 [Rhagoletis pomonella]